MKLWHPVLISSLPRQLLLALHRDCCALRGLRWGKGNNPKTRFLWNYTLQPLEFYHLLVIVEMEYRNFKPAQIWKERGYRGKKVKRTPPLYLQTSKPARTFREHNDTCLTRDRELLRNWITKASELGKIDPRDFMRTSVYR